MRLSTITAGALGGIGALHVAWGLGSSVPFPDRAALAEAVVGADEVPSPVECFAVAGALAAAAALVADVAPVQPRLRRLGVLGAASVLGVRGLAGVSGATNKLVPWEPAARFVELDRTVYGPLCLVLSAGSLAALGQSHTG